MRTVHFEAPLFGDRTAATRVQSERVLSLLLEALTTANELWLRTHPNTPPIYQAGVRYQREPTGQERWTGIAASMKRGILDCEDAATWRAAELRRAGIAARPVFTWREQPDGTLLYHILVRLPNGQLEDPSRVLGMR